MTRVVPRLLRVFAFGLIVVVALAYFYAPALREQLGPDSWWATLLPLGPISTSLWIAAAALNAGAAFQIADLLES